MTGRLCERRLHDLLQVMNPVRYDHYTTGGLHKKIALLYTSCLSSASPADTKGDCNWQAEQASTSSAGGHSGFHCHLS